MITHGGRSVFPTNDGAPSLEDVAVGLGRTARFAGQTRHWYPVLSHVITVSRLVEPRHRIHGLLHDAPESIVGDVPTTWKTDAARDHEDALLYRIYRDLDLMPPGSDALADVARADHSCLIAEAHVLGHAQPTWWDDEPDADAVRWTKGELRFCRQYLRAARAQTVYGWHIARAIHEANT